MADSSRHTREREPIMAVKETSKRVMITMTERDQEAFAKVARAWEDDTDDFGAAYMEPTYSNVYRSALYRANYAELTKKPLEAMDFYELALFVATAECKSDGDGWKAREMLIEMAKKM